MRRTCEWGGVGGRAELRLGSHKFAYLTMKNGSFALFARAFFIFAHFADVLVLSTTLNDLFRGYVDDVSTWRQILNLLFLSPNRSYQFNGRGVSTHFRRRET